jgi:hypothetical protein
MPDDIDEKDDSQGVIEKKIGILTSSIVAAGSNDRAIVGLQNLIHRDSIFSRVLNGRGKLFQNRVISGPVQMVRNAKIETRDGIDLIASGQPEWPAMTLAECQGWLEDLTVRSWLTECQHEVDVPFEDATFPEFNPVYHCITVSEFMRYYVGNKAHTHNLGYFDAVFDSNGLTSRLSLPRGECAMAQDWGSTQKHPCATRWIWRPGEGVPLSDSVFFLREMCWPTFPLIIPLSNDPRSTPTTRQLHRAILDIERLLGIKSNHTDSTLDIQFRLFSHERPEAANAYRLDHDDLEPLSFWPIDTKQAKQGILHLQELQHIDYMQFHPFHVDPRTVKDVPEHLCKICGWLHTGLHLKGRPKALYVVADGQGELEIDSRGKLFAKPATDEMGMARTRFEYPRHRPRETSEGERSRPRSAMTILLTVIGHWLAMCFI